MDAYDFPLAITVIGLLNLAVALLLLLQVTYSTSQSSQSPAINSTHNGPQREVPSATLSEENLLDDTLKKTSSNCEIKEREPLISDSIKAYGTTC